MAQSGSGAYSIFSLASESTNARKLAARAVETYPQDWIVIHETLQNALDAIQKGARPSGEISILMDLDRQLVEIHDNGKGFPHRISLLGMGGSDKDDDPDASKLGGNLGVGLKVVIFSSQTFSIESVVDRKQWTVSAMDGHRFREGADVILRPEPEADLDAENGTKVTYTFPGREVTDFVQRVYDTYFGRIDDDLAHSSMDKFIFALRYHFRANSYAGSVSALLGTGAVKPVVITVTLFCHSNEARAMLSNELRNLFLARPEISTDFPNKHWDIAEVINGLPRRLRRPFLVMDPAIPEGGRLQRYASNHILIKKFTTQDEMRTLLRNPYLRQPIDIPAYERFLDQVEGIYLIVGSVDLVEKYLIERQKQAIAASGIPSSHLIDSPVGIGELGYVANIHLIINVKQKLNLGKQTVSNPWLVGKCNEFFRDAFKATLRHVAKAFVGEQQLTTSADAIEEAARPTTAIVERPDLGLPSISLVKAPCAETEVIALFYELIGRGYLSGYSTYALYHVKTYDGQGMMKLQDMPEIPRPSSDSQLQNFEFKLMISYLLDDFETGRKRPEDIALLIVWEDDEPTHPDYQVVDIDQTPDRDRYMTGVDRCLVTRGGRSIQVLVLKDVVDRLRSHLN